MAPRPRDPGIYQIRNTVNGKVYIGSAVHLSRRWYDHKWMLRGGNHTSRHLQSAWNLYGEDAFVFEALEEVPDESMLVAVEQRWLDQIRPYDEAIGYNNSPTAYSTLGVACSPEKAAKIGAANRGKIKSAEWRANISALQKGRKHTEETRQKMRDAHKRNPRKPTPENLEKMCAARRGKPMPVEQRMARSVLSNEDVDRLKALREQGLKMSEIYLQFESVSERTIRRWVKKLSGIDVATI